MEVILKQDIAGLGYKNDLVKVKPGYGRNYLIPRGFAILANKSNKAMINENIRQAAHKAEKVKKDAEALAQLAKSESLEDIKRTLSWTAECKSATLAFADVDVDAGTARHCCQ